MKIKELFTLVQIEQTLFGLPWIVAGICFASLEKGRDPITPSLLLAIVLAFLFARFAGMTFNQWIDADIDKENPRTKDRLIASGVLSKYKGQALSLIFCTLLGACCFYIGPVCFYAFPLMVFLLWLYSYTKRFTWGCHLVLGVICAFGPLFSYLAVGGRLSPAPIMLSLALLCSIAANDAVYALQDLHFDRRKGLKSIPVLLGVDKTFLFAKILHAATIFSLFSFGLTIQSTPVFFAGLLGLSGMYGVFYRNLKGKQEIAPQFFKNNTFTGLIVMVLSLFEVAWKNLS